jgi:hypothetical protein
MLQLIQKYKSATQQKLNTYSTVWLIEIFLVRLPRKLKNRTPLEKICGKKLPAATQ